MEDIVSNTSKEEYVIEIATMLEEHKALNITAIDVQEQNSWTDYFIIATINSQGHMRGVLKAIKIKLDELNIQFNSRIKKIDDYSWTFIDCGFLVIHLMEEETRCFYELEKLWFKGRAVYSSKS